MKKFIITTPHSLEVNIKRIDLSYYVSCNNIDENTIPLIVLHGFGEYAHSDYMNSLHQTLIEHGNYSVITINYTGTFNKIFKFDRNPIDKLINFIVSLQNEESKNFLISIINSMINEPYIAKEQLVKQGYLRPDIDLSQHKRSLELLKYKINYNLCDGVYILERLYEIGFIKSLVSFKGDVKGDHQDFGLIQAIDVLTVIADLKNNPEFANINWSKLSIVGSSHGGYIASMCDKLAPNTFAKIINNAGWLYPNNDLRDNIFNKKFADIEFSIKIINNWSEDKNDINFFNHRHNEIRTLSNNLHINEQLIQTKDIKNKEYVFIHTLKDHLIPLEEKDYYIKQLMSNYNIQYDRLTDISNLDGKTYKTLEHGSSASIKGLVIDHIINKKINANINKSDFELKSVIKYSCTSGVYIINYTNKYPTINFNKI